MRVLITGGAGFIGSHLVDRLLALGHRVRVLDNLTSGKRDNLPLGHRHLEFIEGDVRDFATVLECAARCEAVVHLAAVASVQASIEDPLGTHATNLDGTLHVLEAAGRAGVTRLLYASSAAVYGDGGRPPLTEDVAPNPLSPYAVDKLAGEYYAQHYARTHALNATAFRFFNVYGPRQDPASPYSGVISVFLERLRRGQPLWIHGDGEQTRDFVFVDDLMEVLLRALARTDLAGAVINVGCGVERSILSLTAVLERLMARHVVRVHRESRAGDVRRSCADVSRLQRALGYLPMTPLEAGLSVLLCTVTMREAVSVAPPREGVGIP